MTDVAIVGTVIAVALAGGYLLDHKEERRLQALQKDADVLETYIRNFLMVWWKTSKLEDPAFRWRMKISMINGHICAYVWRHCRHRAGEPHMIVVHSRNWTAFPGGALDRDNRIMDEALRFVESAFKKDPIPITGGIRDE